jgi:cold shock protein
MPKGTVKWFNATKGYGFIQPQGGGKDVFVHISAVERAGLSSLNEGQAIEYEEVSNRGKTSAEKISGSRAEKLVSQMLRRLGPPLCFREISTLHQVNLTPFLLSLSMLPGDLYRRGVACRLHLFWRDEHSSQN